jgi:hypothetical protein
MYGEFPTRKPYRHNLQITSPIKIFIFGLIAMNSHFYLERNPHPMHTQLISLGVLSHNTFYPTMAADVFEILVKESRFQIKDEEGQKYSLHEFHEKILYSFSNSPPVISLNALP